MWSRKMFRYLWGLGALAALVAIACGASATSTSEPNPTATAAAVGSTPTPNPSPTPALTGTTPDPTPAATVTPSPTGSAQESEAGQASSELQAPDPLGFSWEILDVDDGVKPAIALTSEDVPFVAYMLEARPGFVKNAVWNGTDWDIATLAEGYFYGPLDIAIGPGDAAHISYHDHDEEDAAYGFWNGTEWEVTVIPARGHDGWDNRIVVDSQGNPHISAVFPSDFNGNGIEYYGQDAAGQWMVESVGSAPLTYQFATSIAVDPQGIPHISFYTPDTKNLALASRTEAGWTINIVDDDEANGKFSSLIIDAEGRFHISYTQRADFTSVVVKYATRGPEDAGWDITEVGTLDSLTYGFVGARNITSLVLDSQGNPWIAYSDEKVLKLARWDGTAWESADVIIAGTQPLGQLVSLKLDSQDQPHMVYFDVVDKSPLTGRVRYARGIRR
ncbi:MAG: hypothetical protein IIC97_10705 [Chloroflexi bacterium]|nr:hypothetical protein [Chloroflexota bacterium]